MLNEPAIRGAEKGRRTIRRPHFSHAGKSENGCFLQEDLLRLTFRLGLVGLLRRAQQAEAVEGRDQPLDVRSAADEAKLARLGFVQQILETLAVHLVRGPDLLAEIVPLDDQGADGRGIGLRLAEKIPELLFNRPELLPKGLHRGTAVGHQGIPLGHLPMAGRTMLIAINTNTTRLISNLPMVSRPLTAPVLRWSDAGRWAGVDSAMEKPFRPARRSSEFPSRNGVSLQSRRLPVRASRTQTGQPVNLLRPKTCYRGIPALRLLLEFENAPMGGLFQEGGE